MTLAEQIKKIDPEKIISLKNEYGEVFWIGRAKFVFNHVTREAWVGTSVKAVVKGE